MPPRNPQVTPEDFSWAIWLLEGFGALRREVDDFCPPEDFWKHLHASEREFLLAWRVLIDHALERNSLRAGTAGAAEPPAPRRQSIDIDFT